MFSPERNFTDVFSLSLFCGGAGCKDVIICSDKCKISLLYCKIWKLIWVEWIWNPPEISRNLTQKGWHFCICRTSRDRTQFSTERSHHSERYSSSHQCSHFRLSASPWQRTCHRCHFIWHICHKWKCDRDGWSCFEPECAYLWKCFARWRRNFLGKCHSRRRYYARWAAIHLSDLTSSNQIWHHSDMTYLWRFWQVVALQVFICNFLGGWMEEQIVTRKDRMTSLTLISTMRMRSTYFLENHYWMNVWL